MNFLSGMKPTENRPLTQEVIDLRAEMERLGRAFELTKDGKHMDGRTICSIIKQCGESGVYMAKFGGVELKLAPKREVFHEAPQQEQDRLESVDGQQYIESEKELAKQEQLLKQTQLEELEITNPALYEELMMNGELTDGEETQA